MNQRNTTMPPKQPEASKKGKEGEKRKVHTVRGCPDNLYTTYR